MLNFRSSDFSKKFFSEVATGGVVIIAVKIGVLKNFANLTGKHLC